MKILAIHADRFRFTPLQKGEFHEEYYGGSKEVQDVLVLFTCIEDQDEVYSERELAKVYSDEVESILSKMGAKINRILIYPYAHLSNSLASLSFSMKVFPELETEMKNRGYEVIRAPFGWYKSKERREVNKEFKIILNGEVFDISEFDLKGDFEKLVKSELKEKEEEERKEVKLIREKEIAWYEETSDVGHLKWFPKGKLMRDLIYDYVLSIIPEAYPVETPIMYDLGLKEIREHADKFGERQYRFKAGKREVMLRFAACFGQFMLIRDTFLNWKDLPLRIYEYSTYSFRFEQRGEVVGLKRLRAFTMPDMHTICRDMDQAREEFLRQVKLCLRVEKDLNLDFQVVLRVTSDFLKENMEFISKISREIRRPILLEILEKRTHYWDCKIDFAQIDSLGRPIEDSTVQIDVESGERFGIRFQDESGEMRVPIILHFSPTGSVERAICSMMERVWKLKEEKKLLPTLPTWISPIQVRVIPVSEKHLEKAIEIAERISENNIRVDVDDRNETLSKRMRDSQREWIPYVVVIGDRE
ncbi:threonine--tRNA ligase, partial [Candidatus Bathyarchaeota archaeon ex4484_205]